MFVAFALQSLDARVADGEQIVVLNEQRLLVRSKVLNAVTVILHVPRVRVEVVVQARADLLDRGPHRARHEFRARVRRRGVVGVVQPDEAIVGVEQQPFVDVRRVGRVQRVDGRGRGGERGKNILAGRGSHCDRFIPVRGETDVLLEELSVRVVELVGNAMGSLGRRQVECSSGKRVLTRACFITIMKIMAFITRKRVEELVKSNISPLSLSPGRFSRFFLHSLFVLCPLFFTVLFEATLSFI